MDKALCATHLVDVRTFSGGNEYMVPSDRGCDDRFEEHHLGDKKCYHNKINGGAQLQDKG